MLILAPTEPFEGRFEITNSFKVRFHLISSNPKASNLNGAIWRVV